MATMRSTACCRPFLSEDAFSILNTPLSGVGRNPSSSSLAKPNLKRLHVKRDYLPLNA